MPLTRRRALGALPLALLAGSLVGYLACRPRPLRPPPDWSPAWLQGELAARGLEYEWREVPTGTLPHPGIYFRRVGGPAPPLDELVRHKHGVYPSVRMAPGWFWAGPSERAWAEIQEGPEQGVLALPHVLVFAHPSEVRLLQKALTGR